MNAVNSGTNHPIRRWAPDLPWRDLMVDDAGMERARPHSCTGYEQHRLQVSAALHSLKPHPLAHVNHPLPIATGAAALGRLREETDDLRTLDVGGFRRWMERHLARWHTDPVFVQRTVIREIRRRHPELAELERERRDAALADAGTSHAPRLDELAWAMEGAGKAIDGLGAAMEGAEPARRDELGRRREAKRAELERHRREQAELLRASPERRALLRVDAELERMRAAVGLHREEARLRELQRERGRRGGRGGSDFEETALAVTRRCILPALETEDGPAGELRVLRGVTLGAAGTELDQLVVRPSPSGGPAEVLALVEAKRNPNDLAHGFRRRQENLAWLTGDATRYDAVRHRTSAFPTGHFDRAVVHHGQGERTVLDPGSFARFGVDAETGWFLDRLYFVTRPGTLWGVSGAALGRIAHRVATDEVWDPDDDAYLGGLLGWARSLAGETEAPDVVRLFASSGRRARQLLLVAG